MPLFTLHRNYVLRTTKGHSIMFVKGKEVNVPDVCVSDAVAIGAVAVDAADGDVLGEEAKPELSLTPDQRKAKLFEAFDIMKKRNERNDFTASGTPDARRILPLLGFEISSRDRDAYWLEFKTLVQEDKTQATLDLKVEQAAED